MRKNHYINHGHLRFFILWKQRTSLWCPLMAALMPSASLSHSPLLSSFHLFSFSWYCFHFSDCQGFPLHVYDFSIPSPQESLLSQLTDICQWRSITTIADVEMLIPSPLGPRLPGPLHIPAGSCFCPLSGLAAGPRRDRGWEAKQPTTNQRSKSSLMCKAN